MNLEIIYVKCYGFLSFAKNMGTHPEEEIKTASRRAIQKRVKATGDLTGNKIDDKITSVSKKIFKRITFTKWWS